MLQVDARAWVAQASVRAGRSVGLADIARDDLGDVIDLGFDLLWLTSGWRIGPQSRRIWRSTPWVQEQRMTLVPDGTDDDIVGWPDAIADYAPSRSIGGEEGLRALRSRLAEAGIGLILDFVPNHTATDHPWVRQHPERYVRATDEQRTADPEAYFEVRSEGRHWIAHGRDPNYPPWPDTAQLDHRRADLRKAMIGKLKDIATLCDGVVCRMAMLVLDDVFRATWAERSIAPTDAEDTLQSGEFWWHAGTEVRNAYPDFLLIGEAYWGTEWRLQRLGFDYTFDQPLLGRLLSGDAPSVLAHLRADEEYQRRSVRYLEHRGEPAIAAQVGPAQHRALALAVATAPGMLLLSDTQVLGHHRTVARQVGRYPDESGDEGLRDLYTRLMEATEDEVFRLGHAIRIEPQSAWPGNSTHEGTLARLWVGPHRHFRLVVANLTPFPAQAYVPIHVPELAGMEIHLDDQISPDSYVRDGDDLLTRGLYLDVPAFGCHLFRVSRVSPARPRGRARPRPRPADVTSAARASLVEPVATGATAASEGSP
jgi:hypothetical protein